MPEVMNREIIKAVVSDMNLNGNGIVKLSGMIVFIPGAVTGDEILFYIEEIRKNYGIGRMVAIAAESPYRVMSDCQSHGLCGGCTLSHISYEYENKLKIEYITNSLRRFGISYNEAIKLISGEPCGYRNKVIVHFSENGKFGYYKNGTRELVEFAEDGCCIMPRLFFYICKDISEYIKNHGVSIISVMLRKSKYDSVQMCVQFKSAEREKIDQFKNYIINKRPCILGLFYTTGDISDHKTSFRHLFGDSRLMDDFLNLKVGISPQSFYQVNHFVAEGMCREICELLPKFEGVNFVDLYCGTGIIGLCCAKENPYFNGYGIEINEYAVEDAFYNIKINGAENFKVYCCDSAAFMNDFGIGPFNSVIIDPPRQGCSVKMLKSLLKLKPEYIIYMSCNPITFARDCSALYKNGYEIKRVTCGNMFPRTEHVECVALISKT